MLKRVFPERQQKSASRSNSQKSPTATSPVLSGADGNLQSSGASPKISHKSPEHSNGDSASGNATTVVNAGVSPSSTNSSPLRSSYAFTTTRLSSSSSSSPVKSEAQGNSECAAGASNNLGKSKNISQSCSSTEFQSLKLESMSTVEDFKSVSKTISSALDRELSAKQSASGASATGNDVQESTSISTPSDEDTDNDPTESLFKQQAKFFCQMKEYLLSQQSSLRQHLEVLNATVALRKKRMSSRRQRFHNSGHSVHVAAKPKPEVAPEIRGNNHELDLMNEFHSCSSTEKSDDDIQVCPLCGVEIEDSENPAALEEHVASHWCSPDDPI